MKEPVPRGGAFDERLRPRSRSQETSNISLNLGAAVSGGLRSQPRPLYPPVSPTNIPKESLSYRAK
jgi:hypothetical protein